MMIGKGKGFVLCLLCLVGILATAGSAPCVDFEAKDGTVHARDGETTLWENVHDRGNNFREAGRAGHLVGPVLVADSLYYSIGASLFEVDPATGVVRKRILLPSPCTVLAAEGDGVVLTIESDQTTVPWKRSYRMGPGGSEIPFLLSGNLRAARLSRNDAEWVLKARMEADKRKPGTEENWRKSPDMKPYLEASIQEMEVLSQRDPTNPWVHFWRGAYLNDLGRETEAMAALRSALAVSPEYDFELLGMALFLDEYSPEMGSEAFRRGMTFLINHGYDPEMMVGLLGLMLYYGKPSQLDPRKDLDRLNVIGERIWDLAPYCENATAMYMGLAEANRQAGRTEEAKTWEARSVEALPYRLWGYAGIAFERSGPALNATLASLMTLLVSLLIKGLRNLSSQRRAVGLARWNPFAWWTRGEILGFLLVQGVFLFSAYFLVRGISAVGRAASMPIGAVSGNLGHPESVEYLAKLRQSSSGEFVYALALQKANELEKAAEIYNRLPYARAKNNLGVILYQQGKEADAGKLFQQALSLDTSLPEAAYNLGQAVTSGRIDRAKKYGFTGPIYAMPTLQMWDETLAPSLSNPLEIFQIFSIVSTIASADHPTVIRASALNPGTILMSLYLLLAAIALLGLFVRAPVDQAVHSKISLTAWGLGFVVPGTARQLSLLGPLMLVVFIFSLFVQHALQVSDGHATNILEAIAVPSVSRAYGIATAPVYTQFETLSRQAAKLWWIVLIVNFLAVLLLQKLRPDPAGPRQHDQHDSIR